VRHGTLTEEQLAKVRAVDKVKKEVRKHTVEGDLDGYRTLFVGEPGKPSVLELATKRTEIVQYILVLLSDLLNCTFSHSNCFPTPLVVPGGVYVD
jgi:V-type H+-transporting ATPase subunit H